jgi:hypothetical protein
VSEIVAAGWVWASGGIVSTPSEVNRFIRGYVGGRLFRRKVRAQQRRWVPRGRIGADRTRGELGRAGALPLPYPLRHGARPHRQHLRLHGVRRRDARRHAFDDGVDQPPAGPDRSGMAARRVPGAVSRGGACGVRRAGERPVGQRGGPISHRTRPRPCRAGTAVRAAPPFKRDIRPSRLPAICPARLPARRPSVTAIARTSTVRRQGREPEPGRPRSARADPVGQRRDHEGWVNPAGTRCQRVGDQELAHILNILRRGLRATGDPAPE